MTTTGSRIQAAVSKLINKVGEPVTWRHRTFGVDDPETGDATETWTSSTITISLQPLTITDKNINVGWLTEDIRTVVTKFSDVLSGEDEIVWNGQKFMVMGNPQDIPAFGVPVAYIVKVQRSASGV